jgi:DNA-directed RNA polymerase sigma subunit (sigma70/sigma32)
LKILTSRIKIFIKRNKYMNIDNKSAEVIKDTTCFAEREKRNITCEKKSCRQWMRSEQNLNCAVIAANRNDEGMTLQQIGDIFEITRMRICQLEKASLQKIILE